MFGAKKQKQSITAEESGRVADFGYLAADSIYLDTACQTLRPTPVIEALQEYYTTYNACGGRVKYEWGQKVDEAVNDARSAVLRLLRLSPKDYVTSFTLNTTYGINLLLQQLPPGRFKRVVTSDIEHNSVFLPTMTLAQRLGTERLVLNRGPSGGLEYTPEQLQDAVVVVNTMSNIDGRKLGNVQQLIADTHAQGGIVIIDAAQTIAHAHRILEGSDADAICFSAHKMYAPSLGVVVAKKTLLASLDATIVGGGTVNSVSETGFELVAEDPASRLEPGLQAFGEIIAFRRALDWLHEVRPHGMSRHTYIEQLSHELYEGLGAINGLKLFNTEATPVISVHAPAMDAHQLAIFLSTAGIMVRSGYFCCHYYLHEKLGTPPLLRFSVGLHNSPQDIQKTVATVRKLVEKK